MGLPTEELNSRKRSRLKENTKKWTKTVLAPGFTWIPSVLLLKQKELGLNPVDLNILLQLICHWWRKETPPYLAKRTVAVRIGKDPSTVQRHVRKLEKLGLLERKTRLSRFNGRQTNAYDLRPLVEKLHPLAVQLKKEMESKKRRREEGRS